MARLNEPPASAPASESIDALKRRFIRQNREIARVNSTQSLRIRNLEAEITRLLAENIEFREQAIKSDQENQRLLECRTALEDVGNLRERLQSKLRLVDGLVIELGSISQLSSRGRPCRRDIATDGEEKISCQPRNSRSNSQGQATERELQEGRLPPIVEGKYFPRKTLDGPEIRQTIDDGAIISESPELGPPPIAHFDVSEQGDPEKMEQPEQTETTNGPEGFKLPETHEKRRKRRTSSLLEDMPKLTAIDEPPVSESPAPRTGEKRKLQVREDPKEPATDISILRSRSENTAPSLGRPKGSRFTKRSTPGVAINTSNVAETSALSPRKILAPKIVNSPRKPTRLLPGQSLAKEEAKPTGTRVERGEGVLRSRRTTSGTRPIEVQVAVVAPELENMDPPPETPHEMELFSPPSTETSGRNSQVKELALTASVEDVLGGNDGRTSRRARGTVSYAEPSLRAKMRRPTKDLVAAVGDGTTLKPPSREPSARAESHERSISREPVKAQIIKSEAPGVPWRGPSDVPDPISPLVSKAARVTNSQSPPDRLPLAEQTESRDLEKSLSGLSIFDGPGASPPEPDAATAQTQRISRRHSSNPTSLTRPIPDLLPHQANTLSASNRPPRPHSAAGHREDDKPGLRRSNSAAVLKSPQPTAGGSLSNASSAQTFGRSERAAARRRSMMV